MQYGSLLTNKKKAIVNNFEAQQCLEDCIRKTNIMQYGSLLTNKKENIVNLLRLNANFHTTIICTIWCFRSLSLRSFQCQL